jgi:hypothetical protein
VAFLRTREFRRSGGMGGCIGAVIAVGKSAETVKEANRRAPNRPRYGAVGDDGAACGRG